VGATSFHREPGQTTTQVMQGELDEHYTIIASNMTGTTHYAAVRDNRTGNVEALVTLTWRSRGYFNFTYKACSEECGPGDFGASAQVLDLLSPIPECHHDETYCQLCNQELTVRDGQWVYEADPGKVRSECTGPHCYHFPESARQADGSAPFHVPGGHGYCSNESAREWRTACRQRLERVALARTVTPGTTVKFPRAIEFTDGTKWAEFDFIKGNTFGVPGYGRYNIRDWREMDFEVVPAA
jgi:hypothetical protein